MSVAVHTLTAAQPPETAGRHSEKAPARGNSPLRALSGGRSAHGPPRAANERHLRRQASPRLRPTPRPVRALAAPPGEKERPCVPWIGRGKSMGWDHRTESLGWEASRATAHLIEERRARGDASFTARGVRLLAPAQVEEAVIYRPHHAPLRTQRTTGDALAAARAYGGRATAAALCNEGLGCATRLHLHNICGLVVGRAIVLAGAIEDGPCSAGPLPVRARAATICKDRWRGRTYALLVPRRSLHQPPVVQQCHLLAVNATLLQPLHPPRPAQHTRRSLLN